MKQGERVYELLKERIINGGMHPNTPVPEYEVSQQLGASRTPVREALQKLAREGLVRIVPGRGAFVTEISFADVVELSQMREALESYAARLASQSPQRAVLSQFIPAIDGARSNISEEDAAAYYELTQRLENTIAELTGNRRLQAALGEVWAQVARMRRAAATNKIRVVASIDERIAIIEAIVDGDAERADQATRTHLANSVDNLLRSMRSSPPMLQRADEEASGV